MKPKKWINGLLVFAGLISVVYLSYTFQFHPKYKNKRILAKGPEIVISQAANVNNKIEHIKKQPDRRRGPIYFKPTKIEHSCSFSNLQSLRTDDTTTSIPKIVHWIYSDRNIPEQYKPNIQHCQKINSDHQFIFWSDESALNFIQTNYPDYLYLFKKFFTSGLEFTDALRYFILLHFGGTYIDLDVKCKIPFSAGLKPYQCILDRERETQTRVYWASEFSAMNSVMACRRSHPFFQQAVDKLKISAVKEKGVLARTGPAFLTTHYVNYNKTNLMKTNPVILAPASLFSPLMDVNHLPIFRSICIKGGFRNKLQKDACDEFKKNGYGHGNIAEWTKNSITIHQYMHLGWGSWKHMIRVRLDICKLSRVNIFKKS